MPSSFSGFLVRSIKTLPYYAVTIGPLLLCIGLWMNYSAANFSANSIAVEALVVTLEERRDDDGMVYRPTFEAAHDGNKIQYVGNMWVAPKPHQAGDIVLAYYDPASGVIRSDAMLNQFRFIGSDLTRIGGVFVLLGFTFFWWRRYSSR